MAVGVGETGGDARVGVSWKVRRDLGAPHVAVDVAVRDARMTKGAK